MGTTTLKPLLPGHDVRMEPIYEAYVRAYGDYDKACDEEDSAYYSGLVDAYYDVLVTLGAMEPFEDDETPEYAPTFPAGTVLAVEKEVGTMP